MFDFLFRKAREQAATLGEGTVALTGAFLDEVKALRPGQVIQLKGRDGQLIAVLDWSDYEHIMERAGMRSVGKNGDGA